MGIFDQLRSDGDGQLTPRAAMLLALITMVAADGEVDTAEFDVVTRIDGPKRTADWDLALQAAQNLGEKAGTVRMITELLDMDQRRFVMVNLIDIAMADGLLDGAEADLLDMYVDAFDLPDAFLQQAVDVIAAKNDARFLRR